ncbi:MAG: large subunit ribosomal protein L29 [Bacteroidia bacterium]|jgi:large subunit ribosomal protein L29
MKVSEIKQMGTEELQDALSTSQAGLRNLRFANTVSPLENTNRISASKKEIARVKTELQARAIDAVTEKIKSGELTMENASEFVKNTKLATQLKLAKVKQIINNSTK